MYLMRIIIETLQGLTLNISNYFKIPIDSNVMNFLVRKFSMTFFTLYFIYNIFKKTRYKYIDINLEDVSRPVILLILSYLYSNINLDLYDKILILIILPVVFLIELLYFFRNKKNIDLKEKRICLLLIIAFFIIELLYLKASICFSI